MSSDVTVTIGYDSMEEKDLFKASDVLYDLIDAFQKSGASVSYEIEHLKAAKEIIHSVLDKKAF